MTTSSTRKPSDDVEETASDARETAARLADTVTEAAAGAGETLARAAETTTTVLQDAERNLRTSPDVTLAVVGSLSIGVALGLLAANANRLLVFASLVPALLVASAVSQRGRMWRGGLAG